MASLTDRQQDDLHKAMLDYLHGAGFSKTYEQFKGELPSLASFEPDPSGKTSGLLVKKWTSVIRMQKRVLDLETRLAQALDEAANMTHISSGPSKKSDPDWLPTAGPAKHVMTGHRDRVNAVSFHPVYSVLVSASDDCSIKVWDWETGESERTLKGHTKRVSDVEYNTRGTQLVSCANDLFIKLWDVENDYKNFATLRGHEHSVSSARFLPGDDRVVSSSRDHTVRIWEIASTHCIKVIRPHEDWIRCAIPNGDGKYIITCSVDHTGKVVETATGETKVEFRGHDNVVETAVFAPSNAIPSIRELIATKTGEPAPSANIEKASISYAVTGSRDKTIKIWDALRGTCLYTLVGHDDWINALIFHPNGQYLLSASDDHTFRIWELKTGRCTRKIEAHDRFVSAMAWGRQTISFKNEKGEESTRAMNVLATGSTDLTVKVWTPRR